MRKLNDKTRYKLQSELAFLQSCRKRGQRWTRLNRRAQGSRPSDILGNLRSITGAIRDLKDSLGIAVCLFLLCLLTGCSTVINDPEGKVISVSERGIGFHIKANSETTGTPDVTFGFWSSAVVFLPTSTNMLHTVNFENVFTFDQTGALQLGIGEHICSGNYMPSIGVGTNLLSVSASTNKLSVITNSTNILK